MSAPELQSYHGNCHCGAFKFTVKLPELKSGMTCNCSICSKKGYIWVFPSKEDLEIHRGLDGMTTYKFGKKSMAHKFCPTCGTAVCALVQTGPMEGSLGINARTLENVDFQSLELKEFDGAAMQPAYEPPVFKGKNDTETDGGLKTYTGNCHCGAVTIVYHTKPLPEVEGIKSCNCSICARNAYTVAYPQKTMVTVEGQENLVGYRYGRKFTEYQFCKVCGVSMFIDIIGPPKERVAAMSPEVQAMVKEKATLKAVNLRTLNNVEWADLKVEYEDGIKDPPLYVVPE